MNLSSPFIKRPIATSLLMIAIFLCGILAYFLLPASSLPEVEYATMQVLTFYPGASPDVMATSVTAPLEKQLGQMPGLAQMNSTSSTGASVIIMQFTLDMSLDVAEQQVQAAINAANSYLPPQLPIPPVYSKVNPADPPILTLALTSSGLPLSQVEDFAETRLAPRISQLSGVGFVSISGGQRPAVRVQANPTALASYGLSLEALRSAISTANVDAPKGNFDGPRLAYIINANDQLNSGDEYKPVIVSYQNNAPVRISDVANVEDGVENVRQAAWMNLEPAIIVNIQRQPGANVIEVVDSIKKLLPKLRANMPSSIEVKILTDRTITIRASVKDVQFELMLSVLLVVLVIYIFLRDMYATIIPSIAVPISLIGTFGAMYLLGFSINNLSLMALTIAAGFVVDDAIVMIENISRYIEQGDTPFEAAMKGAGQIGFTILSLTVSLIAVLIPLLFMSDIIGRLFREFALTLAVTILISAFVSLTLTPMLCAKIFRHRRVKEEKRVEAESHDWLSRVIEHYGNSLQYVLAHQQQVLIIAGITLLLTGLLFYLIPKGFFPVQDTGVIQGVTQASSSISFENMVEQQQAVAKIVLEDPAVENLSSFIGIDGVNTTLNSGRMLITLKPMNERSVNASEIIRRLTPKLDNILDMTLYMQPLQDLSVDSQVSRTLYQYSIGSVNPDKVSQWAEIMQNEMEKLPQLRDVASDNQDQALQTLITIDRDTAYRLGLTMQQIDDTLYDAFGQRQVSTIYTQRNQYHVVLEVLPDMQQYPVALKDIYIDTNNGDPIPLRTFTTMTQGLGPLSINRQGQFPVANLSFNLAPNTSLGEAITAVNDLAESLKFPNSIQVGFQGAAKIFENSLKNEGFLVAAAIIVVYLVLGILYESYIHPVTILSTLPSAGMGALLSLIITRNELSVVALIGIILLIGIVMKNAILMIDFALEQERVYGKSPIEAIYEAAMLRFRPILMTSMAAFFGAVPLALGTGVGYELRQPLGIAIMGGLLVSQLLTLYTTPVIYLAFDRLYKKLWVRR